MNKRNHRFNNTKRSIDVLSVEVINAHLCVVNNKHVGMRFGPSPRDDDGSEIDQVVFRRTRVIRPVVILASAVPDFLSVFVFEEKTFNPTTVYGQDSMKHRIRTDNTHGKIRWNYGCNVRPQGSGGGSVGNRTKPISQYANSYYG